MADWPHTQLSFLDSKSKNLDKNVKTAVFLDMGRQSNEKSVCNLGIKFQPMMFRNEWYNTAQALGSEKKHISVFIVLSLCDKLVL